MSQQGLVRTLLARADWNPGAGLRSGYSGSCRAGFVDSVSPVLRNDSSEIPALMDGAPG